MMLEVPFTHKASLSNALIRHYGPRLVDGNCPGFGTVYAEVDSHLGPAAIPIRRAIEDTLGGGVLVFFAAKRKEAAG